MKLPVSPGFDLSGKRALVAGASSGIGLAAAVALAEQGAEVTLAARQPGKLQDIAAHVAQERRRTNVLELDVSDIDGTAPKRLIAKVRSTSLSIPPGWRDIPRRWIPMLDAVIAVNLRGAYFLTQAVARGLLAARKPGRACSIGLISGRFRRVNSIDSFEFDAIPEYLLA